MTSFKKTSRTAIHRVCAAVFCSLAAAGCGAKSPTGTPGPLGREYAAVEYYRTLKEDTAGMPTAHKKNYELMKRTIEKDQPEKQTRRVHITDGDMHVALLVSWEAAGKPGRKLILSAKVEGVSYSEGTSCKAADYKRMDSSEPFFDTVSIEISCERRDGSSHHVISRILYWNGAVAVNEPLVPDGALRVSGAVVE